MSSPAKQNNQKQSPSIIQLLSSPTYHTEMNKVLPKTMTGERMARIMTTEVRQNPLLGQCCPMSFMGAVMRICQIGLEPSSHFGDVYLIPFRNNKKGIYEVQIMVGYRGLMKLAYNSDKVKKIDADVVRIGDEFDVTPNGIIHRKTWEEGEIKTVGTYKIAMPKEKQPIYQVYAQATLFDGTKIYRVYDMEQVMKAKAASKTGGAVWNQWFEAMAIKTVIRHLSKFLPLSSEEKQRESELAVSDIENYNEKGISQGNTQFIDNNFKPDFQTQEATTPQKIAEEEGAMNEDKAQNDALAAVKEVVDKLVKEGAKKTEVWKFLNVKSEKDLASRGSDELFNMREALELFSTSA